MLKELNRMLTIIQFVQDLRCHFGNYWIKSSRIESDWMHGEIDFAVLNFRTKDVFNLETCQLYFGFRPMFIGDKLLMEFFSVLSSADNGSIR